MANTDLKKLYDILTEFDTAMLITHTPDGRLHARPMVIADVEENCDLWFITRSDSGKVEEVQADHDVHVFMQNSWKSAVSISGKASMVSNRAKIDEVWKEQYKVWFPDGKDDPKIALIQVRGTEAQYWDQSGLNKLKYLYEAARAYVTGTTPKLEEGEQFGTVNLGSNRPPGGKA